MHGHASNAAGAGAGFGGCKRQCWHWGVPRTLSRLFTHSSHPHHASPLRSLAVSLPQLSLSARQRAAVPPPSSSASLFRGASLVDERAERERASERPTDRLSECELRERELGERAGRESSGAQLYFPSSSSSSLFRGASLFLENAAASSDFENSQSRGARGGGLICNSTSPTNFGGGEYRDEKCGSSRLLTGTKVLALLVQKSKY